MDEICNEFDSVDTFRFFLGKFILFLCLIVFVNKVKEFLILRWLDFIGVLRLCLLWFRMMMCDGCYDREKMVLETL